MHGLWLQTGRPGTTHWPKVKDATEGEGQSKFGDHQRALTQAMLRIFGAENQRTNRQQDIRLHTHTTNIGGSLQVLNIKTQAGENNKEYAYSSPITACGYCTVNHHHVPPSSITSRWFRSIRF